MPEVSDSYWEIDCGDQGKFKASEGQMRLILEAERKKVRFVELDDVVINVAFIRTMRKRRSYLPPTGNSSTSLPDPTPAGLRMLKDFRSKSVDWT